MRFTIIVIMIGLMGSFVFATSQTEFQYLSGKDRESPVDWEFMVSGGRNANQWTTIPVPSNWEFQGFGTFNYGHDKDKGDEKGLYRHNFTVPGEWENKRIFIVFEGSMTDTEVKINGQLAGPVHQGGFYRFEYDISKLVQFDKENLLEVQVSKMSANESINLAERKSDYWVFGGIFRPVYLKAVPQEYINWTAIDARADGSFSMHVYLAGIKNAEHVEAHIIKPDGTTLAEAFSQKINGDNKKVVLSTRIKNQKNWTAETPHLYYVDVVLMDGHKVVYTKRERFGFRTIQVKEGEGIFLNGKPIVLKGCDRHSFRANTGRALSRNDCLQDILTMKDMNMNAVRMSHYPPDKYFLDLCDEYGLYVLDELAGWQKPPYDTPTAKRLVKQLVKRDVNNPCILFWDNGNEGGWNIEVDDDFALYDPQKRRVLHPWELHGGIDTDHYESYESTRNKLESGTIYMPTEFLHGLYDGGHGAGLDDYWQMMWGHPLTGGMFLWVFADEGVVRYDKNGFIDTDGNHAPDGILGPNHEREASFYTIKEIWSPVYIETRDDFSQNFNGRIPVENRYDFTNLNKCRFEFKLVTYATPASVRAGNKEIYSGTFAGPDILPREKGILIIPLAETWKKADALFLTAIDPQAKELFTWKWTLKTASEIKDRFVLTSGETPEATKNKSVIQVRAGNFTFDFDRDSGMLTHVKQGAHSIPFNNGPVFVSSDKVDKPLNTKVNVTKKENTQIVTVKEHPQFDTLRWTVYASGWLKLDYAYSKEDLLDYMGVSFDYPENRMNAMTWLGKGPYRVWKNRTKGGTTDVWFNTYKNFQAGTAWDYPEFVGYYDDFHWVVFDTEDGPITIATEKDNLFLRVFSQQDGEDPRHTHMIFPPGDISFLHAIPAIGTKFKASDQYGPQSQKFHASGSYSGTLYFYFGKPVSNQ